MNNILVSIHCCAYNHEPYIRQCLDGFVKQITNFKFEAIVHDDASTDNTALIIKEYATKYPDIIKPIFQKENQYSKCKSNIRKSLFEHTYGKYIAMCEGDDYWIDPLKLQKQVDFLENNNDYTLCCSNAKILINEGELDWTRYENDKTIPTKDIIIGGGLFIQTASLLFRKNIYDDYPEYAKQCHVGDYPLQIFSAIKGKVYWFSEKQVVYRYQTENSWTKTISSKSINIRINGWKSELKMLQGMNEYSNFKYDLFFEQRIIEYIYTILNNNTDFIKLLKQEFYEVYSKFTVEQKILINLKGCKYFLLYRIFNKLFNLFHRK